MSTFRYAALPLVIATVFGSTAARAQEDLFYLAPMGSYLMADEDSRYLDDGYGGTLAFGSRISERVELEILAQYLKYEEADLPAGLPLCGLLGIPDCPSHTKDSEVWSGGVGVNYFLSSAPRGGPFLHFDLQYGKDDPMVNYGVGWDIGRRWALRFEALLHSDTNFTYHDGLFNVGLRIPFGSQPAPPVRQPEPVAVVPVLPAPPICSDGIDNDGDGLVDYPADPGCSSAADSDEYNAPPCQAPMPGQAINLAGCAIGDTIVLRGVNFDFDKATLTPNAKTILDGVAAALLARADIKVELGGHTDSKGSDVYNEKLSDRRSKSVKEYLVSAGVPADRMTTRGYGEVVPVADNATDEGRELNRRVELKVTESVGGVTVAPPVPVSAAPAAYVEPTAAAPIAAAEPATAGPAEVKIVNFAFSPASITVAPGTTVVWLNDDGSNHNVTFTDATSCRMKMGATYTRPFSAPGEYGYHCSIHPNMSGTVVVL